MTARRTTAAKPSRALKAVPNVEQPATTSKTRTRKAATPKTVSVSLAALGKPDFVGHVNAQGKVVEGAKPAAKPAAKTAEKPASKRTRQPAAKSAANAPAKKAAARKGATKAAPAKAAPKLSTEQDDIPTDPAELRQLIKITRDRRWRAGRRGDTVLVELMTTKLDKLTAAAKAAKAG